MRKKFELKKNDVGNMHNSRLTAESTGVSFSANVNGNDVVLSWTTATETNSLGFEVQKSLSGQNIWTSIGLVKSAGNSTTVQSYNFIDRDCNIGNYSYRLKLMDYDGSFKFNNEVYVQISIPSAFNLEQNYPNPFNPSTSITYSIPVDGIVKLIVYDALGNEVAILENGQKTAGTYSLDFNSKNLSSGVYFYKLQTKDFTAVKKMLLSK